jgi:hypothetical protein
MLEGGHSGGQRDGVYFSGGSKPPREEHFGQGGYQARFRESTVDGQPHRASLYVTFTKRPMDHLRADVHYEFVEDDLIAMLGGVFKVDSCGEAGARLTRIDDGKLPKGVVPPKEDSITIQLSRVPAVLAQFHKVQVRVDKIEKGEDGKYTSLLRFAKSAQPAPHFATVRTGDVILVEDKGHEVRSIIPADSKTRVLGWVELSALPTPEADLIRDKKPFVRPMPKEKDQ